MKNKIREIQLDLYYRLNVFSALHLRSVKGAKISSACPALPEKDLIQTTSRSLTETTAFQELNSINWP
jgi:hypothetical protein